MPEVGYVVACRDLHGAVGMWRDPRKAQAHAIKMNALGLKARLAGKDACQYVVVEVMLDVDDEPKKQFDTHPGIYL